MVNADSKALMKKEKYLKNRLPIYAEMIDWLVDLLSEVYRVEKQVRISTKYWDHNLLSARLRSGKSIFTGMTIPIDIEITRDLYNTLVLMTEHRRGELKALESLLSGPKDKVRIILRSVLDSNSNALESICRKHLADASLAGLLIRLALWPSMRQVSIRAEEELDLTAWGSGNCPVCGSWPGLATLNEEDSPRALYCTLCNTSWSFPRLKCPFCDNDQTEYLFYVYAEEEKDLRVDMCECCGHGIRTLDARYYATPIIPFLDELVTSHLVMAAKLHNNKNIVPNV